MLTQLPTYITILFLVTTFVTMLWLFIASKSKKYLLIISAWAVVQSIIGYTGLYQITEAIPPLLMVLGIFPTIILMIVLFATKSGRAFIDGIHLKTITYLHFIRLPIEIVLAMLYMQGVMSILITYEGTNFDIFSGISAPIIGYYAFKKGFINKTLLIGCNMLCLLLLINVVGTAIFSIPSPFQKFAFDQPNIAVLYFPFCLLPTLVVPIVLFSHLVALRKLFLEIE